MKILIGTVQSPFMRGGAELHAENLQRTLADAGYEAEILSVPFTPGSPDQITNAIRFCRNLDVSEFAGVKIDRFIGLKFPAYLIPHPNKVQWILHQHRVAYDLWDDFMAPRADMIDWTDVRERIRRADSDEIPKAKAVFSNSRNVARRLKDHCGVDSVPLYHPPPLAEQYFCLEPEKYFFFPSRINRLKRQQLVLEALACTANPVRVLFAGHVFDTKYGAELKTYARKLGVETRVKWLGWVPDERKLELYARSAAILYPPLDEDFGYVTLESMLASKPVVTCEDSGGPLEFVKDRETGLICEPTREALAGAMDELWEDVDLSRRLGVAGRNVYEGLGISWSHVVESLTG